MPDALGPAPSPHIPAPAEPGTFTDRECLLLTALRGRYAQDRDLFEHHELARLRFIRWLYEAGRLQA
jgi:hypothetical protein